jgi:hypothetical protein
MGDEDTSCHTGPSGAGARAVNIQGSGAGRCGHEDGALVPAGGCEGLIGGRN